MRITRVHLKNYKRFTDLLIRDIPTSARLVVMVGPNGSGKSSVFDAFLLKSNSSISNWSITDGPYAGYLLKDETTGIPLTTHEVAQNIQIECDRDVVEWSKAFSVRSAYRNESDFSNANFAPVKPAYQSVRFQRIIDQDQSVAENYSRLGRTALHRALKSEPGHKQLDRFRQDVVGDLKRSMEKLFEEPPLGLQDLGSGIDSGSFRFEKGAVEDFHYKNLSGGEKAAFDLLLDIFVKRREYKDAIYCIDEPESHIATAVQGRLLEVILDLIPTRSQLWIATHSTGFVHKAVELSRQSNDVTFLDFSEKNFDEPMVMTPRIADRYFFNKMYDVLQDDLAGLIAPACIVLCEGKKSRDGTDARLYNRIFEESRPDTLFVSRGGASEVVNSDLRAVLPAIVPKIRVWQLVDRDDMTAPGREEMISSGVRILRRREIENYLWDKEVVRTALQCLGLENEAIECILLGYQSDDPLDDVKEYSQGLFRRIGKTVKGIGNTRTEFALQHLAPALRKTEEVYRELYEDVFSV